LQQLVLHLLKNSDDQPVDQTPLILPKHDPEQLTHLDWDYLAKKSHDPCLAEALELNLVFDKYLTYQRQFPFQNEIEHFAMVVEGWESRHQHLF
jgi:hypothetical protein